MHLPVLQLSAVSVAMPFASGQAADQIFSQAISHGAVELTPVSPHMCGLRLDPMTHVERDYR
jgi:hypothetical protein